VVNYLLTPYGASETGLLGLEFVLPR